MSNTILTKNELLKLFKENIINFLDALIEQFNKESDFITLRVLFDGQIPIEEALNVFSQRIIPFLDMIKNYNNKKTQ
jgi:hypothetical protein